MYHSRKMCVCIFPLKIKMLTKANFYALKYLNRKSSTHILSIAIFGMYMNVHMYVEIETGKLRSIYEPLFHLYNTVGIQALKLSCSTGYIYFILNGNTKKGFHAFLSFLFCICFRDKCQITNSVKRSPPFCVEDETYIYVT